jgi:hypothetical protein
MISVMYSVCESCGEPVLDLGRLCDKCAGFDEALIKLVDVVCEAVMAFESATGESVEALKPKWRPDPLEKTVLEIDVDLV